MSQKVKDNSTGQCLEVECKEAGKRLGFCEEHFSQFKFGSIKKNGLRPTDYERKMEQYLSHKNSAK